MRSLRGFLRAVQLGGKALPEERLREEIRNTSLCKRPKIFGAGLSPIEHDAKPC